MQFNLTNITQLLNS